MLCARKKNIIYKEKKSDVLISFKYLRLMFIFILFTLYERKIWFLVLISFWSTTLIFRLFMTLNSQDSYQRYLTFFRRCFCFYCLQKVGTKKKVFFSLLILIKSHVRFAKYLGRKQMHSQQVHGSLLEHLPWKDNQIWNMCQQQYE